MFYIQRHVNPLTTEVPYHIETIQLISIWWGTSVVDSFKIAYRIYEDLYLAKFFGAFLNTLCLLGGIRSYLITS